MNTLLELLRGLGWVGGILYLLILGKSFWQVSRHKPCPPTQRMAPPKIHVVRCSLCGENAHDSYECAHPDAPTANVTPMPVVKTP